MLNTLKNRWLFKQRAKIYDASSKVEWVDSTMYDSEKKVDRYDTSNTSRALSTFNSPIEVEFLDMLDALKISSLIDLGCGAGAFYHLVASVCPDIGYSGYDLSSAQIARAKLRFGEQFSVRNIASISQEEFAQYEAIHAYSVFPFMSVSDQLQTIGRMLNSGANVLIETSVTIPDAHFAPRSCFKDFSGEQEDGRTLFTAISFPFRSEIESLINGTDHIVTFTEITYGSTVALNNSTKSGGALVKKSLVKQKNKRFEAYNPTPKHWKLFKAHIASSKWIDHRKKNYSDIPADQVQKELLQRLKSL